MTTNKFFVAAHAAGIRTTEPVYTRTTGQEFGKGSVTGQRPLSEAEVVSRLQASNNPNHQAFLQAYYASIFQG